MIMFAGWDASAALSDQDRAEFSRQNILAGKNPGFENGKAGWTASGGTFTTVTSGSNLLTGKVSATWDSSSAGQTFSSLAVTIPNWAKGIAGELACVIQTPSGTATHVIEAYDGTNILSSVPIISSTGPSITPLYMTFPSSGTIQLRLKSVASNEPLIAIDECRISRIHTQPAYIGTETTVYSMTIGAATTPPTKASSPAYDKATWYRAGDRMIIEYHYRHTSATGAAAGSGIYKFPLPAGYTIDTTKVAANNDNLACLGSAGVIDSTNGSLIGCAVYYDTTNISVTAVNATAVTNVVGSGTYGAMTNATVSINFVASVPIVGWGATGAMSTNETQLSTVRAHYAVSASSANLSIADNAEEIIDFDTQLKDTNTAVTTGTSWKFTAPKKGTFLTSVKIEWATTTNLVINYLSVYKNGSFYKRIATRSGSTTNSIETPAVPIEMEKGDYFDVRIYQDDSASAARSLYSAGGTGYNYISITEVPDFSIFSTYGVFELLTTTSSTKTPGASGHYHALTGNSITLTPGTWKLVGVGKFNQAGSPAYTGVLVGIYAANGADSVSVPAALSTASGLTILSASDPTRGTFFPTSGAAIDGVTTPITIVRVTSAVTVYFDTYADMTTPASARITVYGNAERLQ